MSCSTLPGLTEHLPEPTWLAGPHGRLAFHALPAERPWLHVLISHGFGEHSGWWYHVARELQGQGVSAYLFDHYHHGRSAGSKADVADYAHLVAGLRTVLTQGVAPHAGGAPGAPAAPLVVLAHSNGALVTLLALDSPELAPVRALVLCSPYLGMRRRALLSGGLVTTLMRWLKPGHRMPVPTRPWRLTALREIWPRYFRDPLRFRSLTVRFFLSMRRALARVERIGDTGGRPLLLLSAGQELVVSRSAMLRWFTHAQAPAKARRHYPALHHELFNEEPWCEILAEVVAWCRDALALAGPAEAPAPARAGD